MQICKGKQAIDGATKAFVFMPASSLGSVEEFLYVFRHISVTN